MKTETQLEPRFENAGEIVLGGLDKHYPFEKIGEIPQLWQEFVPQIPTLSGIGGDVAYGVCHQMDDKGFRYMAAVEKEASTPLPAAMTQLTFPASRYAVFTHPGDLSTLCDTMDFIWQKWVQESRMEPDCTVGFFERYGENFNPETRSGDIEIWVPLKA